MNYFNIWYCVGAAALAIAGTYIFWGPSNRPKRKKFGYVPGLVNLGNSCFLNAVLQALASCPSSISWLQKIVSSASESVLKENYLLIEALLSILKSLNGEEELCSGEQVIEALRAHRWIISNEEQDAHELFHVLTSTIEDELKSANPVMSLLDAGKLEDGGDNSNLQVPSKSFISSTKTDHSRLASPVCGLLVSELKCNMCNSKYPARYDNFDSISLAIPSPHWTHLQDLLMKFISCELVQDVKCDFCIKQHTSNSVENNNAILKSVFTKQLSFGKLPKCLCIHIQRTVWLKNGVSVKNYEYVAFPEVLIMDYFVHRHMKKNVGIDANYMQLRLTGGNAAKSDMTISSSLIHSSNEENCHSNEITNNPANILPEPKTYKHTYMLKAVIVHLGDTSSGHFITYRRGSMNSQYETKWYYISDAEVKEVSFSEVSRSCAYMLFYESLSDQNTQKF